MTPKLTKYIPIEPTPKQTAFLLLDDAREVFYGGSAGPGKSTALLAGALQYVDVPGYAALILRRNYKQLAMPGALMAMSHEWLAGTDAHWDGTEKQWTFPSGAKLMFGHMTHSDAKSQYQSAEFQYIAIDEITDFVMTDALFMFSRLRRRAEHQVPLRFRAASNPGGRSHAEVKARYVDPRTRADGSVFIPATLNDNPHLDREAYIQSLQQLHPLLWRQLLRGDWEVAAIGELFQPRTWMANRQLDACPPGLRRVRYWDLAATEPSAANPDPDWTAGVLLAHDPDGGEPKIGRYIITHATRFRLTGGGVSKRLAAQAAEDTAATPIWIEQERGGSGKNLINVLKAEALLGYRVKGDPVEGDKVTRATPTASYMENGHVWYVPGEWCGPLFDELEAFPSGAHDDQVDALAGAFNRLRDGTGSRAGAGTGAERLRGRTTR